MAIIKSMMVLQPGNNTLIARNVSGDPLDLSSANDIVRGNASIPSLGWSIYLFTSPTEVSVNGNTSVSVLTDGSTYNNDVGGNGVDIIFKSGRNAGDTCRIQGSFGGAKKDTQLGSQRIRNYGGCDTIKIGGFEAGSQRGLIRFALQFLGGFVAKVTDSKILVYGSKITSATAKTFELYEILPPNADWVEGSGCNTYQSNPGWSVWNRKIYDESLPNNGIRWEGEEQGGPSGCIVSGVDYAADKLASVSVSGLTDQWYAYEDDSGRLNAFIEKTLSQSSTNPGMVSQISSDEAHRFEFFSGNYTTDITLRPKMVFVYEQTVADTIPIAKAISQTLSGFLNFTLGHIDRIVKSEIPALSNISEVYRSANRVIGKINTLFPGVMETELAFTRKVADTTENLTFNPSPTTGAEALTNGGFDNNADKWALESGYTWNSGAIDISTASPKAMRQVEANQAVPIVLGKAYEVIFTITNYVSGKAQVRVGNTGTGADRSSNGTFTETIVAAGSVRSFEIRARVGANLICTIDTVSCTVDETPPPEPDTIVTTTDLSASVLPGRVAYVYGTQFNDGLYYIGSVSGVTITLVGVSKLIAETVSATISIYDVQAHEILPETNTILTHTTSTMTDSGVNEFERMGVKEDDIIILVSSAFNNGAYSIASSKGLEITLQSDESLMAFGPAPGRIQIIRPSIAYQFDTENNELKLPDYVKKVVKVFENDKELTPRSFEYTNNPNNSSELAFNTKERSKIRFPSGIGGNAGDEIRVKVKKDIIEFLYVDSKISIVIPALMKEIIIAGTLSLIYANPKYRDMNLFKFNNDIYVKGLKEMIDLEIEYSPPAVAKRDYDYFPGAA